MKKISARPARTTLTAVRKDSAEAIADRAAFEAKTEMFKRSMRLGFPAASGDMVTQGHADFCQEFSHAVHIVDGTHTGWCARCGEPFAG